MRRVDEYCNQCNGIRAQYETGSKYFICHNLRDLSSVLSSPAGLRAREAPPSDCRRPRYASVSFA